jgi:membrane protein required for colicin V production
MILDSIITIACILAFYRGWKKGIVSAILSMIGVFAGTILSLKLSHFVAEYSLSKHILNTQYVLPIAFILIFIATILLFRFVIKAIEGLLKIAMLGWANRLIGAALYLFFTLFFVSALFWLANIVGIITPEGKQDSKAYSFVEPIAPKAIELASKYLPFCKTLFNQIKNFNLDK